MPHLLGVLMTCPGAGHPGGYRQLLEKRKRLRIRGFSAGQTRNWKNFVRRLDMSGKIM